MSPDGPGGVALITGISGRDGHYLSDHLRDRTGRKITVVNASSCEIFAGAPDSPQTEDTPLRPISPYGVAKAMGHMMCQVHRAKGIEASNAVAAIAADRQDRLVLGDLTIKPDWGWAPTTSTPCSGWRCTARAMTSWRIGRRWSAMSAKPPRSSTGVPLRSFADIVEAMVVSDLGQEQSR